MKRNFKDYLLVYGKGLFMGAADIVPGVSGGTIAFISGIYEELVETIHKLDFKFFKVWKSEGFLSAWKTYNLSFLLTLVLGIFTSIVAFANLILWLMDTYPIPVWAFFFGLILASIIYVAKQINRWTVKDMAGLVIASILSYLITIFEPMGTIESNFFLFFAGFIAIIAMILPGISGAFILILIGAYAGVMGIITQLSDGLVLMDFEMLGNALIKVLIFGIGAIVGLKSFSGILNWMFKNYKNLTLAVLTGFMIGALNKIWPWKEVLEYRINSSGKNVPFIEKSILPSQYSGDSQLFMAVIFVFIGFLIIFLIEFLANLKTNKR